MIWGDNGSGKTSILEAIHTLSLGKSFRTHKQKSMVMAGDRSFVLKATFLMGDKKNTIAAQYDLKSGQKIRLNGKTISNRKDLLGKNNVVVLSPEEQDITKGGPENRRRFFDKVFCVVSPAYLTCLQEYGRILKQRNAAILQSKEDISFSVQVDAWNERLAEKGVHLWNMRAEHIESFVRSLRLLVSKYDGVAEIEISYSVKKTTIENYIAHLQKTKNTDLKFGRTTYGPHRDDIVVCWEGKNIRDGGSQGEHKLCLVFLKLTEMVYIANKLGNAPTLLLDDLFAKLDLERSKALVKLFGLLENEGAGGVQTIITTTDMYNIENSGMLLAEKEIKTHHLERTCST